MAKTPDLDNQIVISHFPKIATNMCSLTKGVQKMRFGHIRSTVLV